MQLSTTTSAWTTPLTPSATIPTLDARRMVSRQRVHRRQLRWMEFARQVKK